MTRKHLSTGSPFGAAAGCSCAVVCGNRCHVAGTTGYDDARMTMPPDVVQQARNALATIAQTLQQAGFGMDDVVRACYIVTDRAHVAPVFAVLAQVFADIRPAATMIIAGLIEPDMKVEIEVTAERG